MTQIIPILIQHLGVEMAKSKQGHATDLSLIWVWISQLISIIGLIGIIDDLKSWQNFLSKLYALLFPWLSQFLQSFGFIIHRAIELWRMALRPVYHLLFDWLHLQLPYLWIDITIVVIFIALGTARYLFLKSQADQYDDGIFRGWAAGFLIFASMVIFPPGFILFGIKDKQREQRKHLMELAYIYMRNTTILFSLIALTFLIIDTFFYKN
jgi:hypothetical protein